MSDAVYDPILARALGEVLREARRARGLTRVQAGKLCRPPIHQRTFATYEQATRNLTVDRLQHMCGGLGLDLVQIVAKVAIHLV